MFSSNYYYPPYPTGFYPSPYYIERMRQQECMERQRAAEYEYYCQQMQHEEEVYRRRRSKELETLRRLRAKEKYYEKMLKDEETKQRQDRHRNHDRSVHPVLVHRITADASSESRQNYENDPSKENNPDMHRKHGGSVNTILTVGTKIINRKPCKEATVSTRSMEDINRPMNT